MITLTFTNKLHFNETRDSHWIRRIRRYKKGNQVLMQGMINGRPLIGRQLSDKLIGYSVYRQEIEPHPLVGREL